MYLRRPREVRSLDDPSFVFSEPISLPLLSGHLLAFGIFCLSVYLLFVKGEEGPGALLVLTLLVISGLSFIALGGLALMPISIWSGLLRGTARLWIISAAGGFSLFWIASAANELWIRTAGVTLQTAAFFLRPFYHDLIVHPRTLTIGTPKFEVVVLKACSGLQGIGLLTAFIVIWLWLYRAEYRFPRALMLLPVAATISFFVNALRIAGLIALGNAGAPEAAINGIHSQAGWIGFIVLALGLGILSLRVAWLKNTVALGPGGIPEASQADAARNPTLPWLLPLLAILAAGVLATMLHGGFELFYPVRFLTAASVLWYFRRDYAKLDLRVSWFAPFIGILVFLLWTGLDYLRHVPEAAAMPTELAELPVGGMAAWIAFRFIAAATTVPIAEELAFRGFLIRRLACADFENLSLRTFTWMGLFVSSIAFGALHGDRWLAGMLAGFAYAGALLWRGRIADSIVAHATTNLLIAILVLTTGRWGLW